MHNNKTKEFNSEQQELAEWGKVFSHPARIAIVQMLAEKNEIKTINISDFLPIGRTTVSRHLKELKNAGIIQGTIDGLNIHYCLDIEKLKEILDKYNLFLKSTISDFMCKC